LLGARLPAEGRDWAAPSGTPTVAPHIKALRRKLGAALIRTVHGVGYALEPASCVRPMNPTPAPKRHSSGSFWSRARDRDLRPLDPVRSLQAEPGYIIVATVVIYMIVTWAGLRFGFGVLRTFPVAFIASLLVTQILARGMTRPLREMTAAAGRMAQGDYSTRVTTNSQDEVGELAAA